MHTPLPQSGPGRCWLQCQFLKELHVQVDHFGREWKANCYTLHLLIEVLLLAEVGGSKAPLQ